MAENLSAVGAQVWLVHLKSSRSALRYLSFNIIREICYYLKAPLLLYQVTRDFLRCFNCQTSTWSPNPLITPIEVDGYSTWVVLKSGNLLCSGGGMD